MNNGESFIGDYRLKIIKFYILYMGEFYLYYILIILLKLSI